eukprot:TRINITY_DN2836_c0_g1_i1.p1 TRINITY_DN2836_c0_g1~~TRINITY_DN2836_c0_g1_i1.p1  ORF type:complete len:328 (-),score=36.56 TRINITY_DN2836_c0_g1_i1:1183-2136(-)
MAQGTGPACDRRVAVLNIPWSVSWQDLKDHFKPVGHVVRADVLSDPSSGRSKGVGLVEFSTQDEAARAIAELHDSTLKDRKISVREDRPGPQPGAAPVRAPRGGGAGGRGGMNATAGFLGMQDGQQMMQMQMPMQAMQMQMPAAQQMQSAPMQVPIDQQHANPTRVFVGNLAYNVGWQDVKDHMRQAGDVTRVDIFQMTDGRSKGCALVEFATAAGARNALATLNETQLQGRNIFLRPDYGGTLPTSRTGRGPAAPAPQATQTFTIPLPGHSTGRGRGAGSATRGGRFGGRGGGGRGGTVPVTAFLRNGSLVVQMPR